MRVSALYGEGGPLWGLDAYVVGLGPSLRVFPVEFLADKACVLLNDACQYFPELGPVAFSNQLFFVHPVYPPAVRYRVVKGYSKQLDRFGRRAKDVNVVPEGWDHPALYFYSYKGQYANETKLWEHPDFYWSYTAGSVAQFAVQFCVLAGARSVTLVGVDGCELGGDAYAFDGVLEVKGADAKRDYGAHVAGLLELRAECAKRGVPLVSLTPFVGLGREGAQYARFRKEAARE